MSCFAVIIYFIFGSNEKFLCLQKKRIIGETNKDIKIVNTISLYHIFCFFYTKTAPVTKN